MGALRRTRKPTPFRRGPIEDSDLESDYSAGPATSVFRIRTDRPTKQSDPKPPPVAGSSSGFLHTSGPISDSESDEDNAIAPAKARDGKPATRKQLDNKGTSCHSGDAASSTYQNSAKKRRTRKLTARELRRAEAGVGSLNIWSSPSRSHPYDRVQLPDPQTGGKHRATGNRTKERSQRLLISIDETDDSTCDNDSFCKYTPRTRMILSGILPPPKEVGNEGVKRIPDGEVIVIDDLQSESGGSSGSEVRSHLLLSKLVLPTKEVRNERSK